MVFLLSHLRCTDPWVSNLETYYVSLRNYSCSSDQLLMWFQCNYKNTDMSCPVTAEPFRNLILLDACIPSGLYYDKAVACNVNIPILNYVSSWYQYFISFFFTNSPVGIFSKYCGRNWGSVKIFPLITMLRGLSRTPLPPNTTTANLQREDKEKFLNTRVLPSDATLQIPQPAFLTHARCNNNAYKAVGLHPVGDGTLSPDTRDLQINQPTRCNSFTSLLLDVYVWLNMFRALQLRYRPDHDQQHCYHHVPR